MIQGARSSSAPLFNSQGLSGDTALSCASTSEASEKPRSKFTARSAGHLNHDNSIGRLEFQDSKKSMDELKDFARSLPPDGIASQASIEGKSMAGLSRTDSGRRRRILESFAGSDSLPSKPLKRLLYRWNRSATAADLSPGIVPRGSVDVTSKQSSGGRKYMKIALNPSLYESANPSTYKVNFQDLKATKKGHKRIGRTPKQRTNLETDNSEISGHTSHLLENTDDYGKKVKTEYPHLVLGSEISKPAKASTTHQTNNGCGYSPSKGIPKPELGPKFHIRDSAAATLATAQAHAHARRVGQVSLPPGRTISQSQQHTWPGRGPGKHPDRRGASKGPCSVPIKSQMRPQRNSLPKTPRTSQDEPRMLKDTSPVVNGKPQASSTISGTDSCAEDIQSEIDPGEIMNARSAEVIHAQGAFGYHTRTSQKPPRSGPAPTRALPSLPEGHDSAVPTAANFESGALLPRTTQPAAATSPKTKKPKSPPKGHRYRLSPIKNNISKGASCPALDLKPSPRLTEQFPQPPQSLTPAAPRRSREPSPAHRNREVDVTQVMAALHLETQNSNGATAPPRNRFDRSISDLENVPLAEGNTPDLNCPEVSPLTSPDPDKDNHYTHWQSRVERVKALKTRDMERLRSHQDSAISPKSITGNVDTPADADASSHEGAERKEYSQSLFLPLQDTRDSRVSTQPNPDNDITAKPIGTSNAFSPIIMVIEQPPCLPIHQLFPSTSPLLNPPCTLADASSIAEPHLPLQPRHMTTTARTASPALPGAQEPCGSPSQRRSHSSYTSLHNPSSYIAELEARVLAMEKKNQLLERAFMAVINATSGMACGKGSGCERVSWGMMQEEVGGNGRREGERMSGVSGVSEGGVENMLMDMQARMGRLR
ncbi:MAG: hypothetical protein Q9184_003541 [Pyrenodesmia sp. 2 TL-2023]